MTVLITENGRAKLPGKAKRSHNGGARPNVYQRRANKRFLLTDKFFGGNGTTVPCAHCGKPLDFHAIEADRIKPGKRGGGYQQHNIVPSCALCNKRRGDKSLWSFNPNLARRIVRRNKKENIAA